MKKDNKTINIVVYLYTNKLEKRTDGKVPSREEGSIYLRGNKTKGVKCIEKKAFKTLDDIPNIMRKVLNEGNVIIIKK